MLSINLDSVERVLSSLGTSLISLSVLNSLSTCPRGCKNTDNGNTLSNCPLNSVSRTGLKVGLATLAAGSLLQGTRTILR